MITRPNPPPATRHRAATVAVVGALLLLGAAGCATADGAELATDIAGDAAVVIEHMAFTPATLTVPTGTTVTWIWKDGAIRHDVVGDGFASELRGDGTFQHRFDEPGTYTYACTPHPNMTGTIEVIP